jgi:hypothetical protein
MTYFSQNNNIELAGLGNLYQGVAYQGNEEELGFLRNLVAPHAVRKEKAENDLKAVQGEFETLKASFERQINNITAEAQNNQANFDRRKSEILAQIEAKKAEKAAAANAANNAAASRAAVSKSSTETPTTDKGNKGLMIGIGVGVAALTIAGIAYVVSNKKEKKKQ